VRACVVARADVVVVLGGEDAAAAKAVLRDEFARWVSEQCRRCWITSSLCIHEGCARVSCFGVVWPDSKSILPTKQSKG